MRTGDRHGNGCSAFLYIQRTVLDQEGRGRRQTARICGGNKVGGGGCIIFGRAFGVEEKLLAATELLKHRPITTTTYLQRKQRTFSAKLAFYLPSMLITLAPSGEG